MTYSDVVVGRLRDPDFDWADPAHELRMDSVERLTAPLLDSGIVETVRRRIRDRSTPFRQLDWGAWVVPATKAELLGLMKGWRLGEELPMVGDTTHKPRLQRAEVKATIEKLAADGEYLLLLEEL